MTRILKTVGAVVLLTADTYRVQQFYTAKKGAGNRESDI